MRSSGSRKVGKEKIREMRLGYKCEVKDWRAGCICALSDFARPRLSC